MRTLLRFYVLALCVTGAQGATSSGFPMPGSGTSAWEPMRGSPPAGVVTRNGKQAFHFVCPFSTERIERASWDHKLKLDLSSGRGIEFSFLCADPSPVSYFSLYFQSGAGWYHGSFFPESVTGWHTIRIDKSDMSPEGNRRVGGASARSGSRPGAGRKSAPNFTWPTSGRPRFWAWTPKLRCSGRNRCCARTPAKPATWRSSRET